MSGSSPPSPGLLFVLINGGAVDTELEHLARAGMPLVIQADSEYPENLTHVHDPPPLAHVPGSLVPQDQTAIASMSARSASAYGRDVAKQLGA